MTLINNSSIKNTNLFSNIPKGYGLEEKLQKKFTIFYVFILPGNQRNKSFCCDKDAKNFLIIIALPRHYYSLLI